MDILWTSKYAPEVFNQLKTNERLTPRLQKLAECRNMPHMIFYGPDGGGKRCRINCLLTKVYGRSALRTTKETYTTKHNSSNIEVSLLIILNNK